MDKTKRIQLEELNILKAVMDICERHSLRYFAFGGTMLGAVRHHGFIPWDDDIDIGMPRADYERFLKIAEKELKEPYQLLLRAGKTKFFFAKVHNVNTTFIEGSMRDKPDWYKGVYIDIMPFDGMPKSQKGRTRYSFLVSKLLLILFHKRFSVYTKSWIKNCIVKMIIGMLPDGAWYALWRRLVCGFCFETSEYTSFTWEINVSKLTFPKKLFDDLEYYDFEDIKLPILKDYDTYLSIQYGDYMMPPPESEQVAPHQSGGGFVDLKGRLRSMLKKALGSFDGAWFMKEKGGMVWANGSA